MCGVCGIVTLRGDFDRVAMDARAESMVAALAHRGPDESGLWTAAPAVLGATRLAVRGLESGKQPVVDEDTGIVAVCNGEIDNHRELRRWLLERGHRISLATDVAVIPGLYREWGEEFVERLAGAFAIAVWDPRQQRLLLARDRAGERPLFFSIQDDTISFATEVAALASDDRLALHLDRDAMGRYLQCGAFASPTSPFAEIQKVAPAEVVTLDATGVRRRRYWRWNLPGTLKHRPAVDAFDQIFRGAVERQSDVDVPYGVFLSGGVDSSLIAAVVRQIRPQNRIQAYTLRFSEESYDEGHFAAQVAERLDLDPVTVWVEPDDFPRELSRLVSLVGEPLADPAWIPTALLARRAAQDVKVVLVGEGGDELFGGYPTYLGAQLAERYRKLPRWLRRSIDSLVMSWPVSDKKVALSFLLKRFVQGIELEGLARHRLWTANIAPPLLTRLGITPPEPPAAPRTSTELLDLVQQYDLETSLAEGLLTKADRASMQSALELRAPFLDQTVMEFAATLPVNERIRGTCTKAFLKRYAERYLPRAIVYRRKRGLSVPLGAWLRGPLNAWAETRLQSASLADVGVNTSVARELLVEHRQRRADHTRALWALLVLSEWLDWATPRIRR